MPFSQLATQVRTKNVIPQKYHKKANRDPKGLAVITGQSISNKDNNGSDRTFPFQTTFNKLSNFHEFHDNIFNTHNIIEKNLSFEFFHGGGVFFLGGI